MRTPSSWLIQELISHNRSPTFYDRTCLLFRLIGRWNSPSFEFTLKMHLTRNMKVTIMKRIRRAFVFVTFVGIRSFRVQSFVSKILLGKGYWRGELIVRSWCLIQSWWLESFVLSMWSSGTKETIRKESLSSGAWMPGGSCRSADLWALWWTQLELLCCKEDMAWTVCVLGKFYMNSIRICVCILRVFASLFLVTPSRVIC